MTDLDRTRLVKARERLASYADAINEVRSPLNRSLHDVLGRLAELSNYMSAPPPTAISLALDTPTFARLIEWAETLGRAWGPVDRSDTYLWRDLQSTDIGPSVSESRRRTLDETMASVQALGTRLESVDEELGLGLVGDRSAAQRLLELLRLLDRRYDIDPTWLHTPNPNAVDHAINNASIGIDELNTLVTMLTREYADDWHSLSSVAESTFTNRKNAVAANGIATPAEDDHTAADVRRTQIRFEEGAAAIAALDEGATRLAETFRVEKSAVTPKVLERLAQLAQLADPVQRPEPTWFGRAQSSDVAEARRVLDGLIVDLKAARARVEEVFRPSIVPAPQPRSHCILGKPARGDR